MKKIDLVGQKFGRLTVIGRSESSGTAHTKWLCDCECGKTGLRVAGIHLRSGHTKSCGCYHKERTKEAKTTHGMSHSKEFVIWAKMRDRCANPNCAAFKDYGERGIAVCERWEDFSNFYADMGPCPDGYSIERLDNNGGYEPSNCVWADAFVQAKNRRKRFDNTSSCTGVYADPRRTTNKWFARITRNGKSHFLGDFENIEAAIAARKAAEQFFDLRSLSDNSID